VKSVGKVGDAVEGDVYFFTVKSVRACGEASGTERARIVVGAEVEIRAKSRLTVSPRDVTLQSGGIVFYASVDPDRRVAGCGPLLKHAWLQKGDAAKGFVVFDVPAPEPPKLQLGYVPTRWGGAGGVRVELDDCLSCDGRTAAGK
jgi:hypothetical protein